MEFTAPQSELTKDIIRCAIEVHRELGPGLKEEIYEAALEWELRQAGHDVKRQIEVPVTYKGIKIKPQRENKKLDMLVDGIAVELKATPVMEPVFKAQCLTYVKMLGLKSGHVLNFGRVTMKEGIARVVNETKEEYRSRLLRDDPAAFRRLLMEEDGVSSEEANRDKFRLLVAICRHVLPFRRRLSSDEHEPNGEIVKMMRKARKGFVLPMSLIATVLTLMIVAAAAAHYTNLAQRSREYMTRTNCRLAAQSGIELAKLHIGRQLEGQTAVSLGNPDVLTATKDLLNGVQYASPTNIGGCTVSFGHDNAKIAGNGTGDGVRIPVYATATQKAGRRTVSVTLQESVNVGSDSESETIRPSVFDYAYFTSGAGNLVGRYVRVNGDVRANGNFTFDAATVNGFAFAGGTLALKSSPKIWAYGKYNTTVATEYKENGVAYAPVRPTNPPAPAAAKPVAWPGGFDAPGPRSGTLKTFYDAQGNILSQQVRKDSSATAADMELTIQKGSSRTVAASGEPIVHEQAAPIALPMCDDLDVYRAFAEKKGGSLTCLNCAPSDDGKGRVPWGVDVTYTHRNASSIPPGDIVREVDYKANGTKITTVNGKKVSVTTYGTNAMMVASRRTVRKIAVRNGHMIDTSIPGFSYADCTGDTSNLQPFEHDVYSPYCEPADKGAVILIGSDSYPITINGPVVFASDVIIAGVVTGQGTIYAGRNIHIVGDLTYRNPPTWPHPDPNPEQTRAANAGRDMLVLVCNGSIVIGDYGGRDVADVTNPNNSVTEGYRGAPASWLTLVNPVEPFIDGTYALNGKTYDNYCQPDPGRQRPVFHMSQWIRQANGQLGADLGHVGEGKRVSLVDIKRYETVCGNYVLESINSFAGTVVNGVLVPHARNILADYSIVGLSQLPNLTASTPNLFQHLSRQGKWFRHYLRSIGRTERNPATVTNEFHSCYSNFKTWRLGAGKDLYDEGITEIDAVLCAKNGILGLVGGSKKGCTISGAVICRDECLIPCFTANFPSAKFRIDWDIRLMANSPEYVDIGLPDSIRGPSTATWQEVPDDHNPAR